MKKSAAIAIVLFPVALGIAGAAWAHHSYAIYDMTRTKGGDASIKEFRYSAPHASGVFLVEIDGKTQSVTLQGAAPTSLSKQGFKPQDLARGSKVKITWHPLRNGAAGGSLATITLADGRTFTEDEFAAAIASENGDGSR